MIFCERGWYFGLLFMYEKYYDQHALLCPKNYNCYTSGRGIKYTKFCLRHC